jgi:hypothetical protein
MSSLQSKDNELKTIFIGSYSVVTVDPVERPEPKGIFYLQLARTEVSNSCPQELEELVALTKELANRLLVSVSAGLSKTLY